ncbi:hypothetical protein IFM89_039463 [Coptis chinensis]|uniref:Fiber protein Fb34 n=1 Tax=Coptis chinensis TaxID=261450 RepID=A0A835LHV0_9MAGN|nr:hypothetical protein IFM89_039463 [Coptis chinensis]
MVRLHSGGALRKKRKSSGGALRFENLRKKKGKTVTDGSNATYCIYKSDIATGYGVGSFLFLLSSQSLLMGITKCMCFGRPLAPGGNRAYSIIYFISSWGVAPEPEMDLGHPPTTNLALWEPSTLVATWEMLTFLIAEACLVGGAAKNAYHTKYRKMVYADFSCESLRKGVFIAGAVFAVATMILNVYYYMYFTKATSQSAHKTSRSSSTVGMTGYP